MSASREAKDGTDIYDKVERDLDFLKSAFRDIMRAYAELVEDADVRDTFMSAIEGEFALVRAGIEDMYGQPLAKTRLRADRLLHLRRVALRPLHAQQIILLRRWRAHRASGDDRAAEDVLAPLLLTINAVAAGLGSTG